MAYNEDSSASGHDEPWIQWFCGLKGHEMFCQVERAYIEDGFNLYGLRVCVSNYSDCLDLILDRIGPEDSDDSHLTQNACTLYGLIHARYIVTTHGLDSMYNKYAAKEFGTCPLIQCNGQPVLPVGLRDEIGIDTTKIFCPKCKCVYQPTPPIRSSRMSGNGGGGGGLHPSSNVGNVDGAAFGTTFPHLFLMTFNNLVPDPLLPDSAYIPRVFGFRVHQSALVRQGGGGGGGGSGGGPYAAFSNNGKRGGGAAVASYSQRSLGTVSSTRATGGSSRTYVGVFGGLPIQDGLGKEGKDGDTNNEEAEAEVELKKADSSLEDGAPAEREGAAEVVDEMNEKATPTADNGDVSGNLSKKRDLPDEGKRSKSGSGSKRPRT